MSDAIQALEIMQEQAAGLTAEHEALIAQYQALSQRGQDSQDEAEVSRIAQDLRTLAAQFQTLFGRAEELRSRADEAESLAADYVSTLRAAIDDASDAPWNADTDASDAAQLAEDFEMWVADEQQAAAGAAS